MSLVTIVAAIALALTIGSLLIGARLIGLAVVWISLSVAGVIGLDASADMRAQDARAKAVCADKGGIVMQSYHQDSAYDRVFCEHGRPGGYRY